MLAGLKKVGNWITAPWNPRHISGDEDYRRIEFTIQKHLHRPTNPSVLSYEEEARLKAVIYH